MKNKKNDAETEEHDVVEDCDQDSGSEESADEETNSLEMVYFAAK
jgi:hypothetical protein